MLAEAKRANDLGGELLDARRFAEAIPHYERACALDPRWYAPHMNLGIACKHAAEWPRALSSTLKALDLAADKAGDGAWWNVGIAATALGDWELARRAWKAAGVTLPDGTGPIDMNIGLTPIRVDCARNPEVVWCHRLDPARAIIKSIPTPESRRRFRDLVLHDGEPRGKRALGERMVSVFDELAVLEASDFHTWTLTITAPTSDDLAALEHAFEQIDDAAFEDWTGSLQILCKACSEGVPHDHDEKAERAWKPERTIAIAALSDDHLQPIVAWANEKRGRDASEPILAI